MFSWYPHSVHCKKYTTNRNRLEVRIANGCLVSPIVFVLAMQLLLKATENNAEIVEVGRGLQMPPVKTFVEDTKILSSKESSTHKILRLMVKQMIWCRIKFKPQKSWGISLRERKSELEYKCHGRCSKNPHCVRRTGEKFRTLVWWVLERY